MHLVNIEPAKFMTGSQLTSEPLKTEPFFGSDAIARPNSVLLPPRPITPPIILAEKRSPQEITQPTTEFEPRIEACSTPESAALVALNYKTQLEEWRHRFPSGAHKIGGLFDFNIGKLVQLGGD